MKAMNCVALTLMIVGALNWGLIGFFGVDLVTSLFGGSAFWVSRVIFALVGLAGLWSIGLYGYLMQEPMQISTTDQQ